MLNRTDRYRSFAIAIACVVVVATGAFSESVSALPGEPIEVGDILGANGLSPEGAVIVTDIMVPDPALATDYPNLPGGVTDADGNGVDGSDPRFIDDVEIITVPGQTPRPAYFPSCPSCSLMRAVEFGNTSPFLPPGSAGGIFVDDDQNPTKFIFQVALINGGLIDGFGRLTGFDYIEQHQPFGGADGDLIGNVTGQVLFLDPDGDGDMDVWRVDHAGDSVGSFGPPPFVLDIDIITEDLNGDGGDDIATFNDLFNVWAALTGNSGDLSGQVWLPLTEDPSEPGMRSLVFNDIALDSQTVAGGQLPRTAPLAGGFVVLAIPAVGSWGVAILLAALAIAGWATLRRGGIAAA